MDRDSYIGKRLDGRYELTELVGEGGMANVYRATDVLDNRMVAVKILKTEYSESEEFQRRFRNESKAIAMMSHPNIVKIYDMGFSDKMQYIVMEFIDGITLKTSLTASTCSTGRTLCILSFRFCGHSSTHTIAALCIGTSSPRTLCF